uniref:Uncharacterized protein n=1 Tax=Schistocephalus solidus TaxID=70667 RepID=A0A0V0J7R5_SCHSO
MRHLHCHQNPCVVYSSGTFSNTLSMLGCERKKYEIYLCVFDKRCLITTIQVKYTDFVFNETVRTRCDNNARVSRAFKERQLRWFGHGCVVHLMNFEAISRLLHPAGVGTAHRHLAKIRRCVMQPKGRLPPAETSAVVHKTGRNLQTHLHEHKLAARPKLTCCSGHT